MPESELHMRERVDEQKVLQDRQYLVGLRLQRERAHGEGRTKRVKQLTTEIEKFEMRKNAQ